MAGEKRVIAFGSGSEAAETSEILLTQEVAPEDAEPVAWHPQEESVAEMPARASDWLAPALAAGAIIAWSGFFAWARLGAFPAMSDAAAWSALVSDWAVPVLLVLVAWLLAMRGSRREAARFGDAARLLSDESARLEARLVTVNRELSLAREFIASQSRDMESLGRVAVERLSSNADRLQALIVDNGARIDSIGSVSQAALENMEKLRNQLPVIASSAKDVTNNIGNAGRTAHAQLAELISGFNRLNDFGLASERQVASLRDAFDQTIGEFTRQCEQLEAIARDRFVALAEQGAEFRTGLDRNEVEALAGIRTRAAALATELEQSRQQIDRQEEECLVSLRARLSALREEGTLISRTLRDGEERALGDWRKAMAELGEELQAAHAALETAHGGSLEAARGRLADLSQAVADFDRDYAERHASQERHTIELAAHSEAMASRIAQFQGQMAMIAKLGGEAEASIATSLRTVAANLEAARTAIGGTDAEVAMLTDNSVRLLELIQGGARQASEDLGGAITAQQQRLESIEQRINALAVTVGDASQRGETLADQFAASGDELRAIFAEIERQQEAIEVRNSAHGMTLAQLRSVLCEMEAQSAGLAGHAQDELAAAIERLTGSARAAVTAIEQDGASAISTLAGRLGEESSAAIEKAMRLSAAEAAGHLEQAAAHAAGVSREATIQLRDQLAKVNELVGNLERRVAHARQRAEEQVDNDFARRVALITESLNSNAIDISKALSADVADTAWAAYLRGDRGIFTRRAVSLLQAGEARAIAQVYENDNDFREHVSRYIHDFEAILRQLLSTRDGHALGVTLLSSDMGKLYVALAQAIERLRG